MTTYIISYDLRAPGRNYDSLYQAIKDYGTWAHINESFWAVATEKSAVDVRDNLLKHLHTNDRLFVIKSGHESGWRNAICTTEWLKEHL